jgi:hypothetical protein
MVRNNHDRQKNDKPFEDPDLAIYKAIIDHIISLYVDKIFETRTRNFSISEIQDICNDTSSKLGEILYEALLSKLK